MLKLPLTIILRLRQSFIPHPQTLQQGSYLKGPTYQGFPFSMTHQMNLCEPLQKFPSAEYDVCHSNPSSQVFPAPTQRAHTRTFLRAWTHRGCDPMLQCGPAVSKINAIIHTHNLFDLHTTFILRTDLFLSFPDIFGWELSWNLFCLNLSIIIMNEAASCQFISILLVFV